MDFRVKVTESLHEYVTCTHNKRKKQQHVLLKFNTFFKDRCTAFNSLHNKLTCS